MKGTCGDRCRSSGSASMVSLPPPGVSGSRWRESVLAAGARFATRSRRRRGEMFRRLVPVHPTDRVLDLGGCDGTYMASLGLQADVYIADVDRPAVELGARRHGFTPVVVPPSGRLPFPDQYFDVVFCSSVIEHVTVPVEQLRSVMSTAEFARRARPAQRQFATEVRRLGKRYFVQTPSRFFPIESHTWMPGIFVALPRSWQVGLVDRANHWWPKTSEVDFHLLNEDELRQAFPDAAILRERVMGVTKSLIAVKAGIAPVAGAPTHRSGG
ncbi:MAG: class I SAM-dependent methyltransferase [Acidimicrobiales bacterium]